MSDLFAVAGAKFSIGMAAMAAPIVSFMTSPLLLLRKIKSLNYFIVYKILSCQFACRRVGWSAMN